MPRRTKNAKNSLKTPTRRWDQRMVRRLKRISNEMLQIGEDMDCYGGLGEIGVHGREMISASQLALDWARGIERDEPWLRRVLDDAKRAYKKWPAGAKPSNAKAHA